MSAIKDGRLPIELGGVTRHFLFSLNAIDEMQDKFGGFEVLDTVLYGKDGIKNMRWLITMLLNEGKDDDEAELTEREVGKMIHTGNLPDIRAAIFRAFSMGNSGTEEDDPEGVEHAEGTPDGEDEEGKNTMPGEGR